MPRKGNSTVLLQVNFNFFEDSISTAEIWVIIQVSRKC